VVGFAGLLDLGYAAFFAIGAYTYALFASNQLASSPIHHQFHLPFWLMLFVGMVVAAVFGAVLASPPSACGATTWPSSRWVSERSCRSSSTTSINGRAGINAIGNIDQPTLPSGSPDHGRKSDHRAGTEVQLRLRPVAYYVLVVIMVIGAVILVTNLHRSRLGRAWMAIREDEVAAAAMGINTVTTKLLAFAIGASFSGFAGAYYAPASASSAPTRSCSWSPSRFW